MCKFVNGEPGKHFSRLALGIGALLAAETGQFALAATPLPAEVDTSRQRLPDQPLPNDSGVNFELQSTEKSAIPKEVEQVKFTVNRFAIEGATVYGTTELMRLFVPLTGRAVSLADVRTVTDAIEARYRSEGYFLTRVFVPPQSISEGGLQIRIIEGYVAEVDVSELNEQVADQVAKRLEPILQDKPIRLQTMESLLLKLNDLPGIKAQGTLRPGREVGASVLVMQSEETEGFQAFTLGNNAATLTGPWSLDYAASLPNAASFIGLPNQLGLGLTGGGGQLEEVRVANASLTFPAGYSDWLMTVGALVARSRPGGGVAALDLRSNSESYSVRGRYPLVRSRNYSLFADTGVSLNDSRSTFSDLPISQDRTTVGSVGLSVVSLKGSALTTVQLLAYKGLNILGAMDSNTPFPSVLGFEPQFTKYVVQAQHSRSLGEGYAISLQAKAQQTGDKLLSGEILAFGGRGIGQGFLPSALTGDKGYGAKVEVSKTLPDGLISAMRSTRAYVFADYAYATSLATALVQRSSDSLSSAGLGLRFAFSNSVNVDLLAGWPLARPDGVDSGPRWLLTVNWQL